MANQQLDFHSIFAGPAPKAKEPQSPSFSFPFLEFFSGGGMARLGLGTNWRCILANDFCKKKALAYQQNFMPAAELHVTGIEHLETKDVPDLPTLAWASFPCQDLSLAGDRSGLKGQRSGTFWSFWSLLEALKQEGRKLPLIVLENVVGALTSNKGQDFIDLITVLNQAHYRIGPLIVDGLHFVPQSRPRLFIIAVDSKWDIPTNLIGFRNPIWHPRNLKRAFENASNFPRLQESWLWWNLPTPPKRQQSLSDIIEEEPDSVKWNTQEKTNRLIEQMSQRNLEKLQWARQQSKRVVGTIYKRTRTVNGKKTVRAEVRFDQVSGCLRTPTGGSSRQTVIIVDQNHVRTRLLSTREAARLMGVPDTYNLPPRYNDAYHLLGDGLVVPAVSWLEQHLLRPLAIANFQAETK